MSKEPYDKDLDEYRCGNIFISADPTFTNISVISIGFVQKSSLMWTVREGSTERSIGMKVSGHV